MKICTIQEWTRPSISWPPNVTQLLNGEVRFSCKEAFERAMLQEFLKDVVLDASTAASSISIHFPTSTPTLAVTCDSHSHAFRRIPVIAIKCNDYSHLLSQAFSWTRMTMDHPGKLKPPVLDILDNQAQGLPALGSDALRCFKGQQGVNHDIQSWQDEIIHMKPILRWLISCLGATVLQWLKVFIPSISTAFVD